MVYFGDEEFWTGDTSSDFNGKLKWMRRIMYLLKKVMK